MFLFLLLLILEDCGYMLCVVFIMDRIFCKFGFLGKLFILMFISLGCGVLGVMLICIIENDRDRKMIIMLIIFILCGVKILIIVLFVGVLFGGVLWVVLLMYFLGIVMIIICGIILKKISLFVGELFLFVMELF